MSFATIFGNIGKLLVKYRAAFISGIFMTMKLSVITVFFGMIFGSIVALIKMSEFHIGKFKPISAIGSIYVEVVRGTPLLLQLYFFVFFLPRVLPKLDLSTTMCIYIALILNSAGYVAEIIRAGIAAVDPGQTEAARCLGLNSKQTLWKIVAPQAVKNILPALGNELVSMVKETSLGATFFIGGITTQSNIVGGATYLRIESIMISALFYLIITATLSRVVSFYEKRLKVSD